MSVSTSAMQHRFGAVDILHSAPTTKMTSHVTSRDVTTHFAPRPVAHLAFDRLRHSVRLVVWNVSTSIIHRRQRTLLPADVEFDFVDEMDIKAGPPPSAAASPRRRPRSQRRPQQKRWVRRVITRRSIASGRCRRHLTGSRPPAGPYQGALIAKRPWQGGASGVARHEGPRFSSKIGPLVRRCELSK